jgi:hypothetical protein
VSGLSNIFLIETHQRHATVILCIAELRRMSVINKLRELLFDLQHEAEVLCMEKSSIKHQFGTMKAKMEALRTKTSSAVQQLHDTHVEMEALRTKKSSTIQQLSDSSAELEALGTEKSSIIEQLHDSSTEIAALRNKKSSTAQQLHDASTEIEALLSPWNMPDDEQPVRLQKYLNQFAFSDNIHLDICHIMNTEFGKNDEECKAIVINKVADNNEKQLREIYNDAVAHDFIDTPTSFLKESIDELLGCSLIDAGVEIVLSLFGIIVLWNHLSLDLDHKFPRCSTYWISTTCTYEQYMRLAHPSNFQLLPAFVNCTIKGDLLTFKLVESWRQATPIK